VVLGTVGLATLGTLFAAMTADLRARELLFPVLLLPLEVPVLLGTVKATEAVLSGEGLAAASRWLVLLGAADAIFIVVGFLTFEFIIEG
jgi:heme exporter protein B